MIKILHVVPTLGYGGVAKVVCNYNDVIDRNQYRFDFVTHGGVEDYHEELLHQGNRIYYFQTLGKLKRKRYVEQVRSQIKMKDYDIVHIHVGDVTGLYADIYKKCGAKKIICHAHTTRAVSKMHSYFEWALRRLAVQKADTCLACGVDAGNFCFGKGKFTVLQNSIDYDEFNNVSDSQIESIKKEFNIKAEDKVVGHVGAFTGQKNHSFLLKIFSDLAKQRKDIRLMLCGKGEDFQKMVQKSEELGIADKVIFCGVRNDIKVLMKVFDVFILPSLHEGLPVVGIEAQTAGVHCLFSDQIDHRVDIGCGLSEFLPIDQGTECWAKTISNHLDDCLEIEKEKIKVALRKSGYEIHDTVQVLKDIYDTLASEK